VADAIFDQRPAPAGDIRLYAARAVMSPIDEPGFNLPMVLGDGAFSGRFAWAVGTDRLLVRDRTAGNRTQNCGNDNAQPHRGCLRAESHRVEGERAWRPTSPCNFNVVSGSKGG